MQLFNHVLINYLECTLSINAAKTVLISQELGHFKMPVDQKSGILLFLSALLKCTSAAPTGKKPRVSVPSPHNTKEL